MRKVVKTVDCWKDDWDDILVQVISGCFNTWTFAVFFSL